MPYLYAYAILLCICHIRYGYINEASIHLPDHYELGLLNGGIYGAVMLYALHCGSSMHAGIIRDIEQGTMIETCYTTYFFIKVSFKQF